MEKCHMKRATLVVATSGNHFPPIRFFTPPSVTRRVVDVNRCLSRESGLPR